MTKIGKFLPLFFAGAAMLWSGTAFASVKVTATVDRNEIGAGDSFVYSINVVSDGNNPHIDSEPKLPSLQGLDLVGSSQSTESRSSFVNGKFTVEQTLSFDYQMSAPQKGKFQIGAAKVIIEGKEYSTTPIVVTVADGGAGAQAPNTAQRGRQTDPTEDPMDDMENMFNQLMQRRMRGAPGGQVNPSDAFFIQVDVDKDKVYAGEQVTASWYLYTRGQIADIDTLKYPDLKGFWKEEIEMATRLNFQQAVVNGVVYQKALLVSYALFPIKAGKALIDPYKAKCTVVVGGPFGFGKSYPFTKASKPVNLEVMEVPSEGRPADYSGAVGNFQVAATADQTSVPANQPVTLKIKFTGRGNAKLIDLPPLSLPPSLELYSQKADAKFFKDGTSYKEFELLLIPREVGQVQFPAVKTSYFDPQTHKFASITSQAIQLNVIPGKPGDAPSIPPLVKGENPGQSPSDVFELPAPMALGSTSSFEAPAVVAPIWISVFALLFTTLGFRSYGVFFRKPKRESLFISLKKRMRAVNAAIAAGDWRKTGAELTNLIYLILGQITEQGGANLEFGKLMDAAPPSLRRELSGPLRAMLDSAEQLGFAPESAVGGLKDKKSLEKLARETEQVLNKAIALSERKSDSDSKSDQKS